MNLFIPTGILGLQWLCGQALRITCVVARSSTQGVCLTHACCSYCMSVLLRLSISSLPLPNPLPVITRTHALRVVLTAAHCVIEELEGSRDPVVHVG